MKKLLNFYFLIFTSARGFIMMEFLVIMAIVIFLGGFMTFSLTQTQQHTSLNTTVDQLVTDIKQQQLKAMINDTEGRSTNDMYGIYFASDKYTLFHGATYSSGDPANFIVDLDTNLRFASITFPNNSLIFSEGSGEIAGFVNGSNTVQIQSVVNNEVKTMTVNEYGTVTGVN